MLFAPTPAMPQYSARCISAPRTSQNKAFGIGIGIAIGNQLPIAIARPRIPCFCLASQRPHVLHPCICPVFQSWIASSGPAFRIHSINRVDMRSCLVQRTATEKRTRRTSLKRAIFCSPCAFVPWLCLASPSFASNFGIEVYVRFLDETLSLGLDWTYE
jgi:hypothetical protein